MNAATAPVAIIGGGPTGMTAALLLAQFGIESVLFDRWDDVYPQPRAVHLDDEVRRILASLGLDEDFASISRPAHGLRLLDRQMRVLAEFRRGGDNGINGFPRANMFDQPALEGLLRARAKQEPAIRFRGGTEVTAISQDGPGPVRVEYVERATGNAGTAFADWLLGCDGANSLVRSSIGSGVESLKFEQRWLVVDIATAADLGEWDGVHQICDPSRAATYMRIGTTRYRWEFRLQAGESAIGYQDMAALYPLIAPWTKRVSIDELHVVRVAEYTFRALVAERWRDRRVFLLGDAAHLTPPFIGQGLGAGLRDAMNLSWKLAGVVCGILHEGILDTYEKEREPHVRSLIRLAIGMGWAMTEGGRVGNMARRFVAPRLHVIPGLRSRIIDSATPRLRSSALVVRSLVHRRLAGALCPNPLLDGGKRFDEVVRGRFALVTLTGPTIQDRATVEQRRGVVVLASPRTPLWWWLRGGHAIAAIVRPDRTVMRASRDVRTLCRMFPPFMPRAATAIEVGTSGRHRLGGAGSCRRHHGEAERGSSGAHPLVVGDDRAQFTTEHAGCSEVDGVQRAKQRSRCQRRRRIQ